MNKLTKVFGRLAISILFIGASIPAWAGPAEDAALREAAQKLDVAAVKSALDKGANPNSVSSDKGPVTPLGAVALGVLINRDDAAGRRALEIAQALIASGARLGILDRGILFFPIAQGHADLIDFLLAQGASATNKIEGHTPTELAVKYGQAKVYDLLVSRGGIPVKKDDMVQLALIEAASTGEIPKMERALKDGARINGLGPNGGTALISAVRTGVYDRQRAEAISWLLAHGADPNLKAESELQGIEGIPLHVFVAMNKYPMAGGINRKPDAKLFSEMTLTRLLRAGARVSGMDSQGKTPLHVAAEYDNVNAAEILIREGARIMAKDGKGKTPLDYAESAPMIKLLKAHGATER